AGVANDWLDNHGRDVVLRQRTLDGGEIIEWRGDRQFGQSGRDAGRIRESESGDAGASPNEKRVAMPVITSVELEDRVALRHRARDANRAHRCLRTAGDEPNHLNVRHALDDELSEADLQLRRNAEARAATHRFLERCQDDRWRVSQHERAPRQHEVDVLVSIDVPNATALATLRDEWLSTDTA